MDTLEAVLVKNTICSKISIILHSRSISVNPKFLVSPTNYRTNADLSDTMPKDAIKFHYQNNIHTDNSGLFVIDSIQDYVPIASTMILPANSAQRHIEINYNPFNKVYYGKTDTNLDIEITTIYVKFIP